MSRSHVPMAADSDAGEDLAPFTESAGGLQGLQAADSDAGEDLAPVPSDWTDSLLERLDALECACLSSGCVCEKAAYIRQRTSPPMDRNQFIELACTTGLGHREAGEYYKNYLVDIRYIQNSERMHELADEIRKSKEMLLPAMSPDAVRPVLERYNNASDEFDALAKHIYEPLSL